MTIIVTNALRRKRKQRLLATNDIERKRSFADLKNGLALANFPELAIFGIAGFRFADRLAARDQHLGPDLGTTRAWQIVRYSIRQS